jgi:hypothetical protein
VNDCFVVLEQTLSRISRRYDMWITDIDVNVGLVKVKVVAGGLILIGGIPIIVVPLTASERFSTLVESISRSTRRPIWQIRGLAFGLFDLGFKGSKPLDVRVTAHVARVLCLIGTENVLLDKIQVFVGADGSRDVSFSAVCRRGAQSVVVGMW